MITIHANNHSPYYFQDQHISFGWINKINDQYQIVSCPYTCKDYMTDVFRNRVGTHLRYDYEQAPINSKEFMMLLHVPETWQARIPAALKSLNEYCKYLKFKSFTITPVQCTDDAHYNKNYYLVTGSGRWMCNTFIVSMAISLIRMFIYLKGPSWKELEAACKKSITNSSCNEISYIHHLVTNDFTKLLENLRVWNCKRKSVNYVVAQTGYDLASIATHSSCGWFHYLTYYNRDFKTRPQWENYFTTKMTKVME